MALLLLLGNVFFLFQLLNSRREPFFSDSPLAMADIIANTLKVAILNFIRPPPWAMARVYFQANDYPLALPSGFTSFLSSWPLQVLVMSIKTPILTYDCSGSSRDQQKELHQRNWFRFGYWLGHLRAHSWRINLEPSVSRHKSGAACAHAHPLMIWSEFFSAVIIKIQFKVNLSNKYT